MWAPPRLTYVGSAQVDLCGLRPRGAGRADSGWWAASSSPRLDFAASGPIRPRPNRSLRRLGAGSRRPSGNEGRRKIRRESFMHEILSLKYFAVGRTLLAAA